MPPPSAVARMPCMVGSLAAIAVELMIWRLLLKNHRAHIQRILAAIEAFDHRGNILDTADLSAESFDLDFARGALDFASLLDCRGVIQIDQDRHTLQPGDRLSQQAKPLGGCIRCLHR